MWFLACYVCDIYNRLDSLRAVTTAVYGRILKIDSTKKITKKLQGAEANTASWSGISSLLDRGIGTMEPTMVARQ
jgi:hypothetical protein